jgi:Domain of unknown function (DUF1902)
MGFSMPEIIELNIHLAYDQDAKVWYIADSDIPGLCLEADNPQALIARIEASAPEMIELNKAEILAKHDGKRSEKPPRLSLRPVFDSPLVLACA